MFLQPLIHEENLCDANTLSITHQFKANSFISNQHATATIAAHEHNDTFNHDQWFPVVVVSLGVMLQSVSIMIQSPPPSGLQSLIPLISTSLLANSQYIHEGLSVPLALVGKFANSIMYASMIVSLNSCGSLIALSSRVMCRLSHNIDG